MSGKGFSAAGFRASGGGGGGPPKTTKQTVFEKQKAEAEAKRKREAEETAAVYKDFVKSFDRDDGDDHHGGGGGGSRGGFNNRGGPPRHGFGGGSGMPGGGSSGGRRHFGTSSGLKSGPGSLGPAPTGFGKKRSFQDVSRGAAGPRDRNNNAMGFEDRDGNPQGGASLSKAFATSDDEDMGEAQDREEEKAVARPTLRLSNVPPGTSPATIKAMLPPNLVVENVKLLPPAPGGGGGTERKNLVVIVTMSPETPATDMDAAVSALQNRYMGYGYYLALHRHLSSAVASAAAMPSLGSSSNSHPFGAKPVEQAAGAGGKDAQQQQGFHRGFAPPTSYGPNYVAINRANILHVPVKPPQDVRTIQLINMVIEGILAHGPEFEALLMSRPEVQKEEKWAWLWDARSEGGIWLRWRLWEVVTGAQPKGERGKYVPLFEGAHAWKSPEKPLPFEYTTKLDEFVSDSEYNSSDEEDMEDEANHRDQEESGRAFLNPLDKAKLTHLLARLPTTMGRLRKGDIARITAFAIMHASRGVDEVVDMIVTNIEKPFSLATANPEREQDREREKAAAASGEAPDLSGASLIGLYVVNDVLSSSSTSGVRHAWRYRQLIEAALRARGTFASLGSMGERLGWGRLRADKWKRSVGLVLNLWEGWCVFPAESQALFADSFENPPSLKPEEVADSAQAGEAKDARWKLVDAKSVSVEPTAAKEEDDDVEGEPMDDADVEGEPIEEDDVEGEPIEEDDIEGEPIEEEDVEGEPIEEDDVAGEPMDEDEATGVAAPAPEKNEATSSSSAPRPGPSSAGSGLGQPRRRMRAADMFADSDGSE